jgi:hypothetical protein
MSGDRNLMIRSSNGLSGRTARTIVEGNRLVCALRIIFALPPRLSGAKRIATVFELVPPTSTARKAARKRR